MKLKNKTDFELSEMLSGVKNGRSEDYELLKKKYEPLMLSEVSSFLVTSSGISRDELTEEAERAFMRAAVTFDGEKKVSFGYYAKRCIRNSLISLRRSRLAKSSVNAVVPKTARDTRDISASVYFAATDREHKEKMLSDLFSVLSDYEKTVLTEYLSGKKPREIAKLVGKSEKSVSNAVFRIKQKAARTGKIGK